MLRIDEPKADRLLFLDAFRGVCCLAVVAYHYTFRFSELYGYSFAVSEVAQIGAKGVDAFFLVSGFVIFMTLERLKTAREFAISRFARLFPAYWIALIATFLMVGWLGLPGREATFGQFLMNFTMLQEFFFVPHVDGAYWTLTVELIFYFWIFWLVRFGLRRYACGFLIGLSAISVVAHIVFHNTHIGAVLGKLILLDQGPLFFSGVVFYLLWSGSASFSLASTSLLAALVAMCCMQGSLSKAFALVVIYLVFYLFSSRRLDGVPVSRALVFLGGLTYPLYLVHQNIGYSVILSARPTVGEVPAIVLAFCVVFFMAILIKYYIEDPAARLIKRKFMHK